MVRRATGLTSGFKCRTIPLIVAGLIAVMAFLHRPFRACLGNMALKIADMAALFATFASEMTATTALLADCERASLGRMAGPAAISTGVLALESPWR